MREQDDKPPRSRVRPDAPALLGCVLIPSAMIWAAIGLAFMGNLWGCWATLAALVAGGIAGWIARGIDTNG